MRQKINFVYLKPFTSGSDTQLRKTAPFVLCDWQGVWLPRCDPITWIHQKHSSDFVLFCSFMKSIVARGVTNIKTKNLPKVEKQATMKQRRDGKPISYCANFIDRQYDLECPEKRTKIHVQTWKGSAKDNNTWRQKDCESCKEMSTLK